MMYMKKQICINLCVHNILLSLRINVSASYYGAIFPPIPPPLKRVWHHRGVADHFQYSRVLGLLASVTDGSWHAL